MENTPQETVIEKITTESYTCWKCGAELKNNQKFCPQCGTIRGEKPKKYCDKCGAELKDGQDFCTKCGTSKKHKIKKRNAVIAAAICTILCITILLIIFKPIKTFYAYKAAKILREEGYYSESADDPTVIYTYVSPKKSNGVRLVYIWVDIRGCPGWVGQRIIYLKPDGDYSIEQKKPSSYELDEWSKVHLPRNFFK